MELNNDEKEVLEFYMDVPQNVIEGMIYFERLGWNSEKFLQIFRSLEAMNLFSSGMKKYKEGDLQFFDRMYRTKTI